MVAGDWRNLDEKQRSHSAGHSSWSAEGWPWWRFLHESGYLFQVPMVQIEGKERLRTASGSREIWSDGRKSFKETEANSCAQIPARY